MKTKNKIIYLVQCVNDKCEVLKIVLDTAGKTVEESIVTIGDYDYCITKSKLYKNTNEHVD